MVLGVSYGGVKEVLADHGPFVQVVHILFVDAEATQEMYPSFGESAGQCITFFISPRV